VSAPNGGGLASGFSWGRDELVSKMGRSSHHVHADWVQWPNTREFKQSDDDWAGADGWTVYIPIPHSSH
jgi:hypothetical protein